jgi:hypothetical protein
MSRRARTLLKLTGTVALMTLFGLLLVAFRPIATRTTVEIHDGRRYITTYERHYGTLPIREWRVGTSQMNACGPDGTTSVHSLNCLFFRVENVTSHSWEKL